MIAGYLRLLVMNALSDNKLTGYDLKKEIEKNTGTWKPSYGSIYPLMEKLLKQGLVAFKTKGRKKVYYLTPKGRKILPELNRGKNLLAENMTAALGAFGNVIDPDDKRFMTEIFNSIKMGRLPFDGINPELSEFRGSIFESYTSGKDKKKIKMVLRNAIRELRSIK